MVDVIDMGITGISGMAFGGPKRDILFVTAAKNLFNLITGTKQEITSGSSLYKVTGLCKYAAKSTSLKIDS